MGPYREGAGFWCGRRIGGIERAAQKNVISLRSTDSSNPSPSSGEAGANLTRSISAVEKASLPHSLALDLLWPGRRAASRGGVVDQNISTRPSAVWASLTKAAAASSGCPPSRFRGPEA
jgi:hypothetical protein